MEEKKNPLSATIGLLLSVIVAMGLGWFAHSIYASSQAKKAQAKAVEEAAAAAAVKPVTVETAQVTLKAINPPQSFMGHVEPIQDVDLRAQIDGTIDAVAFQEGTMVKEGDLLYRIDPRVYEARVAQAKAALAEAEARSENANRYYERISKVDKRSVTEAEVDQAYADKLEAQASIEQCKADLKSAEINLGYCEIRAPISGRIGQSLLKKGDYVSPSLGTLARIVQMDDAIRAQIRLADGSIYAHDGKADFIGNEMSMETASLPVRYAFANPDQLLLSNAYVTVLLSEAKPTEAMTIPANAVLANATGDYVYINENGKAARRAIVIGARIDGMVEVKSGLQVGDEVVTEGVVNVIEGANLNVVNPSPNAQPQTAAVTLAK